jgi:uncharacterized protein YjbI with pentapeptide repeats
LTNTDLTNAVIKSTTFDGTTSRGFTKEQLYSTASYKSKDLSKIWLRFNDLTGWNFAGQNLSNAHLDSATLTNADFTGADTRGVRYLTSAQLATAITTNLIRPDGVIEGLNLRGGKTLWVRDYDKDVYTIPTDIPIVIRVTNGMDMGTDGSLKMIFEADEWDSTISFVPGVPVTLGGTLDLTFAEGVDLSSQVGRQFKLFDWTGVSPTGAFTVLHPEQWVLDELYTTGMVTYVPEPATLGLLLIGMGGWLTRRRQK